MLYLRKCFETVGSAETGSSMSRPQFNQNTQANTQGSQGVVNGGLIDFQDNGYRGVNEQLSGGYPSQGYPAQGYPAQGYPQQQQAMYPGQALPAALQGFGNALGASAGGGGACFSGPPTFLHVNGITYKPVTSDGSGFASQAAAEADPRVVASTGAATTTQPAPTPAHQVLTAEELADIVNERVQTQVDGYLKTQHGHHHNNKARSKHAAAQGGEPQQLHHHSQKTMSAAGGSRALTHEESVAVQRVCQANANIKHVVAGGGGNKPAAGGGNRW